MPIFSSCAFSLGFATFFLGSWAERAGPRKVAAMAACSWGGGLLLASAGVATHTLPLVYLGYGVLGGVGWGMGYISPVSTLMKWFPDRRGLATGLALTAFGGGAMIATPLNELLLSMYRVVPELLGSVDSVKLVTQDGVRFAEVAGHLREVRRVGPAASRAPGRGLGRKSVEPTRAGRRSRVTSGSSASVCCGQGARTHTTARVGRQRDTLDQLGYRRTGGPLLARRCGWRACSLRASTPLLLPHPRTS